MRDIDCGVTSLRENAAILIKNRFGPISGFTLIEMLVGTAILALLLILFFEVVSQMTRVGEMSRAEVDRLDKVGVAFDMIRRDLSAAMLPVVSSSTNNLQFLLNPSARISADMQNPHSFFWQAPVASDVSRGDAAVVGYFIRRDNSVSPPRSSLCRLQINPGDTSPQIGDLYRVDRGGDWINQAILDAKASAIAPQYEGLVVDDALAMWIRAIDENGGYHYEWNSRPDPSAPNALQGGKLPSAVEVALIVADSRTAQRLPALPKPGASNDPEKFNTEIDAFLRNLPAGVRVFRSVFPINSFSRVP